MAVFRYIARDQEGNTVQGSVFAASRLDANDQVRGMGFWPLEMYADAEPVTAATAARDRVVRPLFGGVGLHHLAIFFRQFATMIAAGVPLVQVLYTLSNQAGNVKLRRALLNIRDSVMGGENLAEAFDRHPHIFSKVQRAIIRVGVEGGLLESASRQIAEYLERELALRRLIRRLTFYPKLVMFMALIIPALPGPIIYMITGQGMPPGEFAIQMAMTFLKIFGVLFAVWAAWRIATQSMTIRRAIDAILISLPWIGKTLRQICLARFGRALGALYAAGVPITHAIRISAEASGNEYLAASISPVATKLESGAGIAESIAATGVFPPMVIDMVATGEQTGSLDSMVNKVAEFYEAESEVGSHQAATILGIVALLAAAIYVGYIVISFYSGYFAQIFQGAGE
ncbi:MAG: type II secretion system F family protein [Armatimonadetes bacterium]|nr:type II secretion system F family protein [Armatimonadota bacterium]